MLLYAAEIGTDSPAFPGFRRLHKPEKRDREREREEGKKERERERRNN
jgi:hypothetical protein